METIKTIIFGALLLVASASAVTLFLCMCAVDVSSITEYLKMVLVSSLALGASVLCIKYIWRKW